MKSTSGGKSTKPTTKTTNTMKTEIDALAILKKFFPDYKKCEGVIPASYANLWLTNIGIIKKQIALVRNTLEKQSFFVKGS
jgi:hypothetical protein